jgi:hypothetical protein
MSKSRERKRSKSNQLRNSLEIHTNKNLGRPPAALVVLVVVPTAAALIGLVAAPGRPRGRATAARARLGATQR